MTDHAYSRAMADDRAMEAIGRIERALARIESAAGRRSERDDGELRRLRAVHEALRGKVEGAIAQVDRLLATGERG